MKLCLSRMREAMVKPVLNDYACDDMKVITVPEMERFKVVLTDGFILYMSPAQRDLFDNETGAALENFLLQSPIVRFSGEIATAVASMRPDGSTLP